MAHSKHKTGNATATQSSGLLTDLEAALRLGVTPSLLLSYTKWNCPAKPRQLAPVETKRGTYFDRAELDAFDRYLCEPWANVGAARVRVPKCIEDHLRAESGNQCTRCWSGTGVQTAHIKAWTTSRSHYHHNLIRICSRCHDEHDIHGILSTKQLLAIKQEAIARIRAVLGRRNKPD